MVLEDPGGNTLIEDTTELLLCERIRKNGHLMRLYAYTKPQSFYTWIVRVCHVNGHTYNTFGYTHLMDAIDRYLVG